MQFSPTEYKALTPTKRLPTSMRGYVLMLLLSIFLVIATSIPSYSFPIMGGDKDDAQPDVRPPGPGGGTGGDRPGTGSGSGGGESDGGSTGGDPSRGWWSCLPHDNGAPYRVQSRDQAKADLASGRAVHCSRQVSSSGALAWKGDGTYNHDPKIPVAAMQKGLQQCSDPTNEKIAGFKWSATWSEDPYGINSNVRSNISCVDFTSRSVTVKCYETTKGTLEQTTPNRRVLYPTSGNGVTDIRGRGANEYEACLDTNIAVANVPNTKLDQFGRYRLHLNITYTPKTFLVFDNNPITGAKKAPVKKATGTRTSINKYSYGQVTCNPSGTKVGLNRDSVWTGNWTWTQTDCFNDSNTKPFEYKCTYAGNTRINGQNALNATVMRDGKNNPVVWRTPSLQASTSGPMKTTTMFLRSGTPWDIPKDLPHNNNNVKLSNGSTSLFNKDNGSGWRDGLITNTNFSSTWASETGKPTQITPTYKWAGKFNVQTIIITGFDPMTAELVTSKSTIAIESEAQCTGDRVSLNSVRAVDSLN